jgi:zinc transporter 7
MKISIFCLILLGLIVQSQVLAHAHPHAHTHESQTNSKVKKDGASPNMNLAKSQTSKAFTSTKEEQIVQEEEEEEFVSNVERLLAKYLPEVSKNKVLMMIIAVLIISIPSFPTFLVLVFISKLSPGKQKGGIFLNEKHLRRMICLAIGSLTGDVFFGMMEHIMNSRGGHTHDHDHHHDHSKKEHLGHKHEFKLEVFCILIGIFFFYMVDRIIGGHNHHEHGGHDHDQDHHHEEVHEKKTEKDSQITHRGREKKVEGKPKDLAKDDKDPQQKEKKTDRSAILYLVADFLHNFIDGIGIGVAFTINNTLGVTTTIAIAAHELPHEIGDFAILMKKNFSLGTILVTQLMTATGALFGGLIGIYVGNFAEAYLLGFTAGGFLYLALANMVPELLHSPKKATFFEALIEVGLCLVGVSLIIFSS